MFFEMCGVEARKSRTKRTAEMCAVQPLADGATSEVVNGKTIWHPIWDGQVDHGVNTEFLTSVADHIMDNEKVFECVHMKIHTYMSSCRVFARKLGRAS